MPTRNVVITDHQATFVEQLVANGRYQNASEVLREGLRLVEQRETDHATKLKALRAAIQAGIDDLAAGRSTVVGGIDALPDAFDEQGERVVREVKSEWNTRA